MITETTLKHISSRRKLYRTTIIIATLWSITNALITVAASYHQYSWELFYRSAAVSLGLLIPLTFAILSKIRKQAQESSPYKPPNHGKHQLPRAKTTAEIEHLNLKQAEQLFKNSRDTILVVDSSLIIRYASPSTYNTFQYTEADIVGHPAANMVAPEDKQLFYTGLKQSLVHTPKPDTSQILHFLTKHDQKLAVSVRVLTSLSGSSEPFGYYILLSGPAKVDTPSLQTIPLPLQHSFLLENIKSGILMTDKNHIITYANRTAHAMCSSQNSSVVGKSLTLDFKHIFPEILLQYYAKATVSGSPTHFNAVPFLSSSNREVFLSGIMTPGISRNLFTGMSCVFDDVTLDLHAESKLVETYKIIGNSPLVALIFESDSEMAITHVTDNISQLLGYLPEDFYSKRVNYLNLIVPADRNEVLNSIIKLILNKNVPDSYTVIKYHLTHRTGKIVLIEDRRWIKPASDGKQPQMQSILVDISEQKKSEELFRMQHKLSLSLNMCDSFDKALSIILNTTAQIESVDGSCILIPNKDNTELDVCFSRGFKLEHIDGIKKTVNKLFFKVFFVDERCVFVPFVPIKPEKLPRLRDCQTQSSAFIPIQYQSRTIAALYIAARDKDFFNTENQIMFAGIASQTGNVLARMHAEADLRQEKKLLQSYLDLTAALIVALDANHKILMINQYGCNLLKYSESQLIGQNWFEMVIHKAHHHEMKLMLNSFLAQEEDENCPQERLVQTQDGKLRTILWQHQLLKDSNQSITGILCIGQDVTQRKNDEAELTRYRSHLEVLVTERTVQLEEAQKKLFEKEKLATLGRVIATVSHELRNPLGTIYTSIYAIEQALKTNNQEAIARSIQRSEKAILRCNNIIEDLLSFSRKQRPALCHCELNSWLTDTLEEYTLPSWVKLRLNLAPNKLVALIDPGMMQRVLINLLTNAIEAYAEQEFTEEAQLLIETEQVNTMLEIRLLDNGTGISDEIRQKIFEPLFSTKGFGIGLGIPIITEIMEQHGGQIAYLNRTDGSGTISVLRLPVLSPKKT